MINLNKKLWTSASIGEISKVQYGSSFKSTDSEKGYKTFRMNEIIDGVAIDNSLMKTTPLNEKEFAKYKLNEGDILFNRTNSYEHVGRTGIFTLKGEYMFASYLLRLSVNRKKVEPFYLNIIMNSNWFQSNIKRYATKAVGQANINAKSLSSFCIQLPSINEQKLIVSLFQAIQSLIKILEKQITNILELIKSLINNLLNKTPSFGNLLNNLNYSKHSIGEIAECDVKYGEHEFPVERFVGLEFIESENFKLQGWGEIAKGTTFSKRFRKGDILFGKRRAYLKKVAVADFDGLCSGDILVIKAKSNKMLQGLLQYYISSDVFIQHAVSTSGGSLSPRTKWKDLSDLTVYVPDLKSQKSIVEVLSQIDKTVNHLKKQKTIIEQMKQNLLIEILG